MTFSFLADGEELRLPVPPVPFGWSARQTARSLSVNGTGEVCLPGDPAADSGTLECMFPAKDYPFNAPGTVTNPYYYIHKLATWVRGKKIVRYVATGVVNARVIVEELVYEERDGTGDVYAKIYLRGSPALEAVTTQARAAASTASSGRSAPEETQKSQTYTVVRGDCLSVICRRFYGAGTAKYYNALAKFNGIKNPHLIYAGQVLTIPPKGQLGVA